MGHPMAIPIDDDLPSAESNPQDQHLSGPAIRAFLNLSAAWRLSVEEQQELLGADESTFQRWYQDRDAILNEDQLERISHLLGIYKNLRILLPTTADGWVRRPNSNPLFGDRTALELMLKGGTVSMRQVRLFLEFEVHR